MTYQKNTFMWVFVILAGLILIGQIISLVFLFNIPSKIESNVDKLEQSSIKLDSKLDTLDNINQRVSGMETTLIALTNKYPPNQTVNINNMNQQELNQAINRAISLKFESISDKVEFNFWFNIVIGSLISISFIFYLILGRKK